MQSLSFALPLRSLRPLRWMRLCASVPLCAAGIFPAPVLQFCVSPYSFPRTILMPQTLESVAKAPLPLTALTDDEVLFRDQVRQFANDSIRPKVREMDEKGVFEPAIIQQFFELGLMGVEIPEAYGGAGGTFFESILLVEEVSKVDPSAGVIVDVQNTLVNNALMRWTNEDQKKRYLPKMAADTVGAYALSEAASGSDAFALQTKAALKGSEYILNGRKLWITNAKEE